MALNLVRIHAWMAIVRAATVHVILSVLDFLGIVLEFLPIEIWNSTTFFIKVRDAVLFADGNDNFAPFPGLAVIGDNDSNLCVRSVFLEIRQNNVPCSAEGG